MYRYNPIGLKGRYNMAKKYKDFTEQEKQEYKEKRDAYWKKREEAAYNAYEQLKGELEKLHASSEIMNLLETMVKASGIVKGGSGTSSRETYLSAIFGTENPEIGQTVTFQYVGIRGPKGERLQEGETLAQFVIRVGDISYKYDKTSIGQMLWYLKKRGYNVTKDDDKATVTFNGQL